MFSVSLRTPKTPRTPKTTQSVSSTVYILGFPWSKLSFSEWLGVVGILISSLANQREPYERCYITHTSKLLSNVDVVLGVHNFYLTVCIEKGDKGFYFTNLLVEILQVDLQIRTCMPQSVNVFNTLHS